MAPGHTGKQGSYKEPGSQRPHKPEIMASSGEKSHLPTPQSLNVPLRVTILELTNSKVLSLAGGLGRKRDS